MAERANFIYNAIQDVIVKSKTCEEKVCSFRISVEDRPGSNKVLFIKITDDFDATFLFSLILTQEDFLVLKTHQGLRVDFEHFPRQLAKLLADCKSADKPQFALTLDDVEGETCVNLVSPTGGLFLKVIERNEFKYLCHLSLRMAPSSDEDIKNHLISKLNAIQEEFKRQKSSIVSMESEVARYSDLLEQKNKEINSLEMKLASEISGLRLQHNQEISFEKDKQSKERVEMETRHTKALQDLQANLSLQEHRNSILAEAKASLEASLKKKSYQKESTEKELSRLTAENTDLKGNVVKLEQRVHLLDQNLSTTQKRLVTTEETAKESGAALAQARREVQSLREREVALSTKLNHTERQLQLLSGEMMQCSKEKDRIEGKIEEKRIKEERLLNICRKLERELEISKSNAEKTSVSLVALEKKMAEENDLSQQQKLKLEETEKKLKEQEDTIKRLQDVNTYLHRKLNEAETTHSVLGLKNGSLKNDTASGPLSNSMMPLSNRSLPPWLTSSSLGNVVSSPIGKPLPIADQSSAPKRLDPSYLVPVESDSSVKSSSRSAKISPSAYFPRTTKLS